MHSFIEDICTLQIYSDIREYIVFGAMNAFSSHFRADEFRTGDATFLKNILLA